MEGQLFYLFHLEEHESTDAESWKFKKAEESGRVIVETNKREVQRPGSIGILND